VLQKIRDRNIWLVYATILDLGIAYGISISLIAHHLDGRGFTKGQMGSLAAWFALGIVAFSLPAGAILRRVPAKIALLVSLSGYAVCVTVFPWLRSYEAIAAARVLDGAFSVGVWVSCETILLARAEAGIKALVTSLYAMAIAVGYVLGPLVARLLVVFAPMWVAFAGAGVLTLVAVAVASRIDRNAADLGAEHEAGEAGEGGEKASLGSLVWRIKTSCFATFAYGYFQASVVLFLPLFLTHDKHVDKERTIIIPAFFAAGMLLFSNLAGRLGDRYGHLLLMRYLATIGLVMVLGFELLESYPLMCVAVFGAGATLASISPVSLALQGVVTDRANLSRSNGIYNAFYAAGMLLGPAV
jgi:MFS family permease